MEDLKNPIEMDDDQEIRTHVNHPRINSWACD